MSKRSKKLNKVSKKEKKAIPKIKDSTKKLREKYKYRKKSISPRDLSNMHFHGWIVYLKKMQHNVQNISQKTRDNIFQDFLELEEGYVYRLSQSYQTNIREYLSPVQSIQKMTCPPECIKTLKKMWATGESATNIAKELGGVTRSTVIGKARCLNLPMNKFSLHQTDDANTATSKEKPARATTNTKQKTTYGYKIIQAIPNADIEDIMRIWMNTIRTLSNPKVAGRDKEDLAYRIQNKINKTWIKRYGGKVDENGYFVWPNTDIGSSKTTIASSLFDDWQEKGVLSFYGYHVGNTKGVSSQTRQTILEGVFNAVIPPVFDLPYLYQWGAPATPARLKKIAYTLASNARNFKRQKNSSYLDAIREWEEDLEFMKNKFYIERFHFAWPSSNI